MRDFSRYTKYSFLSAEVLILSVLRENINVFVKYSPTQYGCTVLILCYAGYMFSKY